MKEAYLKSFKVSLMLCKKFGHSIDSEAVEKLCDEYMEMDTDAFDSDDLNEVIDLVYENNE